jgi:hypothetical protein
MKKFLYGVVIGFVLHVALQSWWYTDDEGHPWGGPNG